MPFKLLEKKEETLASLIGLENLKRHSRFKDLLGRVKEASPMVFSFLQAVQDKFVDIFMASNSEGPQTEGEEISPKPIMRGEMTPSRFFKRKQRASVSDISIYKAQVVVKLLTEHLNRLDSMNRFVVNWN